MKYFSKHLQQLGFFSSGILANHYGSKLLDYKDNFKESQLQAIRDAKLDEIINGIKQLQVKCDNPIFKDQLNRMENLKGNIDNDKLVFLQKQFKAAVDKSQSVKESLEKIYESVNKMDSDNTENLSEFSKDANEMLSITEKIHKLLDEIKKGGSTGSSGSGSNNLLGNSSQDFFCYLDNMSLLEEASFLHILIFITIILTVFNLFAVLLSNEIINYFNLPSKYPSLYRLFKLRSRLQRYYLIWNLSILFILSFGGICINILAIYCLN